MEVEQKGIKWWKYCHGCEWQGKPLKQDNDNENCPNCGNPALEMQVDKLVFDGRRYATEVLCDRDRDLEDANAQNEGRQPALPDVVDRSDRGFQFEPGKKPNYKPRRTSP